MDSLHFALVLTGFTDKIRTIHLTRETEDRKHPVLRSCKNSDGPAF